MSDIPPYDSEVYFDKWLVKRKFGTYSKLMRDYKAKEETIQQLTDENRELRVLLQSAKDLIHIHPDNWELPEDLKFKAIKEALAKQGDSNE